MPTIVHKFKIGQRVRFLPDSFEQSALRGVYTVVRLMPSETRDLQYRVKNVQDGHERVVRETQLDGDNSPF
ncbi:MAG TPA: hypothetical protein VMU82_04150 [Acetobacteraceae bacterium]|nr:hypothetical protein [Acetobacteraceae bacterium]